MNKFDGKKILAVATVAAMLSTTLAAPIAAYDVPADEAAVYELDSNVQYAGEEATEPVDTVGDVALADIEFLEPSLRVGASLVDPELKQSEVVDGEGGAYVTFSADKDGVKEVTLQLSMPHGGGNNGEPYMDFDILAYVNQDTSVTGIENALVYTRADRPDFVFNPSWTVYQSVKILVPVVKGENTLRVTVSYPAARGVSCGFKGLNLSATIENGRENWEEAYGELETAVAKAEFAAMDLSMYSDASAKAFKDLIAAGNALLADPSDFNAFIANQFIAELEATQARLTLKELAIPAELVYETVLNETFTTETGADKSNAQVYETWHEPHVPSEPIVVSGKARVQFDGLGSFGTGSVMATRKNDFENYRVDTNLFVAKGGIHAAVALRQSEGVLGDLRESGVNNSPVAGTEGVIIQLSSNETASNILRIGVRNGSRAAVDYDADGRMAYYDITLPTGINFSTAYHTLTVYDTGSQMLILVDGATVALVEFTDYNEASSVSTSGRVYNANKELVQKGKVYPGEDPYEFTDMRIPNKGAIAFGSRTAYLYIEDVVIREVRDIVSVEMEQAAFELFEGESATLAVNGVTSAGGLVPIGAAEYTVAFADPTIAEVKDGWLEAKAAGTTEATVTVGGLTTTFTITVEADEYHKALRQAYAAADKALVGKAAMTPATVTALEDLLEANRYLLTAEGVDAEQAEAIVAILDAIDALETRPDKSQLDATVAAANGLVEADYTADSWSDSDVIAMREAMIEVQADENATVADVTSVIDAYDAAASQLISIVKLRNLINQAKGYHPANYSQNSYNYMAALIPGAEDILANPSATAREVTTQETNLETAIQALVSLVDLDNEIRNAKSIDLSLYMDDENAEAFLAEIADAETLLAKASATGTAITLQIEDLKAAASSLVSKPVTTIIYPVEYTVAEEPSTFEDFDKIVEVDGEEKVVSKEAGEINILSFPYGSSFASEGASGTGTIRVIWNTSAPNTAVAHLRDKLTDAVVEMEYRQTSGNARFSGITMRIPQIDSNLYEGFDDRVASGTVPKQSQGVGFYFSRVPETGEVRADSKNMSVVIYGKSTPDQVTIPLPEGVSVDANAFTKIRIETVKNVIRIYTADQLAAEILLGDKANGVYTSAIVYNGNEEIVGSYMGVSVPEGGYLAFSTRIGIIDLDSLGVYNVTVYPFDLSDYVAEANRNLAAGQTYSFEKEYKISAKGTIALDGEFTEDTTVTVQVGDGAEKTYKVPAGTTGSVDLGEIRVATGFNTIKVTTDKAITLNSVTVKDLVEFVPTYSEPTGTPDSVEFFIPITDLKVGREETYKVRATYTIYDELLEKDVQKTWDVTSSSGLRVLSENAAIVGVSKANGTIVPKDRGMADVTFTYKGFEATKSFVVTNTGAITATREGIISKVDVTDITPFTAMPVGKAYYPNVTVYIGDNTFGEPAYNYPLTYQVGDESIIQANEYTKEIRAVGEGVTFFKAIVASPGDETVMVESFPVYVNVVEEAVEGEFPTAVLNQIVQDAEDGLLEGEDLWRALGAVVATTDLPYEIINQAQANVFMLYAKDMEELTEDALSEVPVTELASFYAATSGNYVYQLLEDNALSLDLTAYNAKNKATRQKIATALYKEMAALADTAYTKAELQALLDAAVGDTPAEEEATKPTSKPSKDDGDSDTAGSSVILPSVVQPEEEDKNEQPLATFTDIADVAWANEAIEALVAKKVISGYEDGTFKPEVSVTRDEFAKMIVLAFGISTENVSADFADVPADSWQYIYVAAAANAGIIKGIGEGLFGSGQYITREDMAVMVGRALSAAGKSLAAGTATFTDSDEISDYAQAAVGGLTSKGIINGMNDGTFAPKASLTRAQAVKVIYEAMQAFGL